MNRKAFEALLYSGAFDSFGLPRMGYNFPSVTTGEPFIDSLLKYADLYRRDTLDASVSLFGGMEEIKPVRPALPQIRPEDIPVDDLEMLHREKDLVGMYLSAHPLDKFAFEIENFTTAKLNELPQIIAKCESEKTTATANVGGFITLVEHGTSNKGKQFMKVVIEDFSGSYEKRLVGKELETFRPLLVQNTAVFIEGKIEEMFPRNEQERKELGDPPKAFRIKKVSMLGNVSESMIKSFALNISTPQLNENFRKKLIEVISKNSKGGKIPLSMFVYDPVTKYNLEFLSKKFQINISAEFINELERLGVRYSIIKRN